MSEVLSSDWMLAFAFGAWVTFHSWIYGSIREAERRRVVEEDSLPN